MARCAKWPYAELGAGRVEIEFNRIDEIDEDELVDSNPATTNRMTTQTKTMTTKTIATKRRRHDDDVKGTHDES